MTRSSIPGARKAVTPRLDDRKVDEAIRETHQRIDEIAASPITGRRIIANVQLADGVDTPIPHGLGRAATWVKTSCPRGAPAASGRVEDVRTTSHDRARFVVLKATGWGATITVDVEVG
jgi:hypothetical protein